MKITECVDFIGNKYLHDEVHNLVTSVLPSSIIYEYSDVLMIEYDGLKYLVKMRDFVYTEDNEKNQQNIYKRLKEINFTNFSGVTKEKLNDKEYTDSLIQQLSTAKYVLYKA